MWRREGAGEAYLYIPEGSQSENFCGSGPGALPTCGGSTLPCTECNYKAGVSFHRGSWFWKKGEWNRVRMTMGLNTPGRADGTLEVQIDGKVVLAFNEINWRNYDSERLIYVHAVLLVDRFVGGCTSVTTPQPTESLH